MNKKLIVVGLSSLMIMTGCQTKNKEVKEQETKQSTEELVYEDIQTEYGKVLDVNGNEVSLKMGTLKEEEQQKESDTGGMDAGVMTEAATAAEGAGLESQLEYSDKTTEIKIDAGLEISSQGKDVGINGIKKGSLVAIDKDKKGKILKITLLD
ncbi:hypothetical protein DOK76_00295 [Vagococcus sp. DIV0080]|uniref:Lipoprotein n=1 Tax=Candidatus Vagococcus giribetii TaxID=2230876 RepID=A0ABS3HP13_9ENTE|nr:hypothetical protein [Vagococcus sp. DIV0080]MBO0475484.1 hypothetical protein [Vagococcus sp. DIV0080]